MKVPLPYGETTLEATLPDRARVLRNAEAATLPPVEDLAATVRDALARPRGLPPIRELVRPGARVLIAFDDATVASYGVPDWSPYAVFSHVNPILTLISSGLGYLGGMIEAVGTPGCTVIMATPVPDRWDRVAHPSYPEVWERLLPETRDPYALMTRFADDYARRPDYVQAYRAGYGFHPVHAIMAVYPLKRLAHAGRVIVAGARDPAVPRHLGFETAATVEEAVARAEAVHGRDCAIGYVEQPAPPRF